MNCIFNILVQALIHIFWTFWVVLVYKNCFLGWSSIFRAIEHREAKFVASHIKPVLAIVDQPETCRTIRDVEPLLAIIFPTGFFAIRPGNDWTGNASIGNFRDNLISLDRHGEGELEQGLLLMPINVNGESQEIIMGLQGNALDKFALVVHVHDFNSTSQGSLLDNFHVRAFFIEGHLFFLVTFFDLPRGKLFRVIAEEHDAVRGAIQTLQSGLLVIDARHVSSYFIDLDSEEEVFHDDLAVAIINPQGWIRDAICFGFIINVVNTDIFNTRGARFKRDQVARAAMVLDFLGATILNQFTSRKLALG